MIADLKSDLADNHQKSCHIEEYKIEDEYLGLMYKVAGGTIYEQKFLYKWRNWLQETWNWNGTKSENSLVFEQHFELPRKLKKWANKPFKTVYTEYEITSVITLIGMVGGTMGMFVGFSIVGASEWLTANCLQRLVFVAKF